MKEIVAEVFTWKGSSTKDLMGNRLARLWNIYPGNMKADTSETRGYIPIFKVYFKEIFEQAEPENETMNNSNYGWRVLRLSAWRALISSSQATSSFKVCQNILKM